MAKISALILSKNEERNIEDCIKSVLFCDEVLVVDDFSTDRTKEMAERLGARVLQRRMDGDWGGQRTFAIQSAAHEWILFVDADERVPEALAEEIRTVVAKGEKRACRIRRENRFHFNEATHGVLHPDYVMRLFPAENSRSEGLVHEKITAPYPGKNLKAPLYHYTYDSWEQYLGKLNHYTTLAAKTYREEGKRCNFFLDIVLRPVWAFIKVYFIERGFLDGKMGWILSVNHYFYTLNKYVKLYYLYKSDGKL